MRTSVVTTLLLVLAATVFHSSAMANTVTDSSMRSTSGSTRHGTTVPVALQPIIYQALAKDSASDYRIGENNCIRLPKQNLQACFDADGAHFSGSHISPLALQLVAWGRGSSLKQVKPVQPVIHGSRTNYHHGSLTAWWQVLPVGIEQGFTITERPDGRGKLKLTLAATGHQHVNASSNALSWGKLRYGKLVVTDANNKVIPAALKYTGKSILITLNDANAAYPLTVDPLVWIEQKVAASDGTGHFDFGQAVALDNTTALIGADLATVDGNTQQGAVYVFTKSNGKWTESGKLTANDGEANDTFGTSISLYDNTALIGAGSASVKGNRSQGAAYIFVKSGDTWTEKAKLTAKDGKPFAQFALSVALDKKTALIGALGASVNGNYAQGAAYVFTKSQGAWRQTAKLTANDGSTYDEFGSAVALAGTTALIGAGMASVNGNQQQGAAYIFTESKGTWAQTAKLTASDAAAGEGFGDPIALNGTTALIGAGGATVDGKQAQGAAYIFAKSNGTWTQKAELTAKDGRPGDFFGTAVALENTRALIGAHFAAVSGQPEQGAIYLFTKSNDTWKQTQKITASDGMANDNFGLSVALDNVTALIGARGATVDNVEQGAAYFYGQSDMRLSVSSPQTAKQKQDYVSQALVTNNASAASPAVALTMAIPAAASFISATSTQGNCNVNLSIVTCDLGAIAGNAGMATANIKFKATGNIGAMIKQSASIAYATPPLTASSTTIIDSPPEAKDGTLTTDEDTSANGTLEANDPDGDPLTFDIVDQPQHGSVTLDDENRGNYTYIPDQDYNGGDSFTFKASDGRADSNVATISITIKAKQTPPPPPGGNNSGGGGGTNLPLGLGMLALVGLLALLRRKY
jgi:hypothetical protein